MTSILAKDVITTVLVPGTPGTPGSPGSPGSPAWDEVIDYDTVGIIGWVDYYIDGSGNIHYLTPPEVPPSGYAQHVDPIYGPIHVHEVIHHPAVPAVPPTPGSPGTTPVVSTNYQLGWNASASSIDTITGDGEYQFSVDGNTIGCFTGLSGVDVGNDYRHIQYGLYFTNHNVEVWESGVHVSASAVFASGDVFTIRRLGPEVAYYQGSTLLYRSLTPSSGTLIAYADLYAGGDQVDNAVLSTSVDSALSETTPGVLAVSAPQPVFWASELNGLLNIAAPQPRIWASDDGAVHVALPTPTVSILSSDFAGGTIYLPSPAVDVEGDEETPTYGIMQLDTPYPSMYMVVDVIAGDVNISVPQPKFLSWTGDGILQVSVPQPHTLMLGTGTISRIVGTLPRLSFSGDGQIWPSYFDTGIHATLPKLTISVHGGARAAATLPKMTAALVATNHHTVIAATLPVMTAALDALTGVVVDIVATLPGLTASAYAGARIVATLPSFTAALTGEVGGVVTIAATMPELSASATGLVGTVATVSPTLPRLQAGGWTCIVATLPRLRALLAENDADYLVTYAYAVTLNFVSEKLPKPVTRYTNYPFHSVVRRGNEYLGFGPSGAYVLSGNDDAGTPIAWNFKFGPSIDMPGRTFGEGTVKRTEGAYFNGRFSNAVTMNVAVDDGTVYTYSQNAVKSGIDTLRFTPGRGLFGIAWQFGLSGTGPMNLYRAEFLQRTIERKVRHG